METYRFRIVFINYFKNLCNLRNLRNLWILLSVLVRVCLWLINNPCNLRNLLINGPFGCGFAALSLSRFDRSPEAGL